MNIGLEMQGSLKPQHFKEVIASHIQENQIINSYESPTSSEPMNPYALAKNQES